MSHSTDDPVKRALTVGIAFWCVLLGGLFWYDLVYLNPDLQLLIPTYWWVSPCAISPFAIFVSDACTATTQVGDTDSIIAAFLTTVTIGIVWVLHLGAIAASIPVAYFYVEQRWR